VTDSTPPSGVHHRRFMPLLMSLVIVLAASPLFEDLVGSISVGILNSLVLLTGVWAMTRMRWLTWLVAAAGAIALILLWLLRTEVLAAPVWYVLTHVSFVAYLAIIGGYTLYCVMRADAVTGDTIRGAICVYLLIGVGFGVMYSLAELEDANAFAVPAGLVTYVDDKLRAHTSGPESIGGSWYMYFSFTTLTTLGYGDITPVSPLARTLAMLEAVIGPLYLAILVARLVAMHTSVRADRAARLRLHRESTGTPPHP